MKTLLVGTLFALSLAAQDQPKDVHKIFQIQHADPIAVAGVINVFPAVIQHNKTLRTISVRATPEIMDAIEEAISRFDVPPLPQRNIELTFHMLLSSPKTASGTLPAELKDVEKQLKSLLGFEGLELMATSQMRMRDGSTERGTEGSLPFPAETDPRHPPNYLLNVRKAGITASNGGHVIRLDGLRLRIAVPYRTTVTNKEGLVEERWRGRTAASLATDIDVKEGQKVVVGKASLDGSDNNLILVVTAKVVD